MEVLVIVFGRGTSLALEISESSLVNRSCMVSSLAGFRESPLAVCFLAQASRRAGFARLEHSAQTTSNHA